MGSKPYFSFLVCLLPFAVAAILACEDNPEECYGDEDCEEGYFCDPTFYNSGSRSGGVCRKTETEEDGGESDASDEPDSVQDAAVRDSSQSSPIVEAGTDAAAAIDAAEDAQEDAALSGDGDAAPDAPEADAEAAVEGGQPSVDGGNTDSAI